jgi:hypothetical protein
MPGNSRYFNGTELTLCDEYSLPTRSRAWMSLLSTLVGVLSFNVVGAKA